MSLESVMGRFAQFYFKVVRNKKSFELSRFRMNSTSGIGVGKYLKAFEKSNTQHDLDFDNFSLECSYGYGYGRFYRVYSDAQYTLTLTYQGGEYDENSGRFRKRFNSQTPQVGENATYHLNGLGEKCWI